MERGRTVPNTSVYLLGVRRHDRGRCAELLPWVWRTSREERVVAVLQAVFYICVSIVCIFYLIDRICRLITSIEEVKEYKRKYGFLLEGDDNANVL